MSKIALTPNASGTGTFTLASPNSSTSRTLTLPDTTGELLNDASSLASGKLTGALPAIDGSALTGVSGTQTGIVSYFAASTAPAGFLKANGAAISRTTYADLFAIVGTTYGAGDGSTTFKIPDLRGEFLRGWDDSRGVDNSRVFGASQGDAFQGHHHIQRISTGGLAGGGFTGIVQGTPNADSSDDYNTTPTTDGSNGTPRTSTETRPRNVALLACIKH